MRIPIEHVARFRIGAILLASLCFTNANAAEKAASACERSCLEGFVDQYLAALIAHDPSRLPVAANVKYTENGQTLKLGDGMWGPASGIGAYKLYFADPQAGQVGFFGVVEENAHPAVVALRLRVEGDSISEIEAIVARKAHDDWVKPAGLVDKPIFREALAPSERLPREKMVAIADSYFEGLEQATDKLTPFDPHCMRVENGNVTAGNPEGPSPIHMMTAGEQFATGFSKFITSIRERRYPVVDEERGLAYAIVFFDHAGIIKTVTMTDGTTFDVPPPFDTPYTFLIGELFKIKDGRINRIEAVLLPVPYGMSSGWSKQGVRSGGR
jgi:hypothetical protein